MKKKLKVCFIPYEGNNYKPRCFRKWPVAGVAILIVFLLFVPFLHYKLAREFNYLAAVLPGVLVDLANKDRMLNQEGPLTISPILEEAAKLKAQDMATKGYFAHNSPQGVTPWYWFGKTGYQFTSAGENLAVNFYDSSDVQNAWMASPGHRANILNNNFIEVGIATVDGYWEGRPVTFVVELFGTPAKPQEPYIAVAVAATLLPPEMVEIPKPTTPLVVVKDGEVKEATVETVESHDLFIAVKNVEEAPAVPSKSEEVATVAPTTEKYSSLFARIALSPREIVSFMYIVLAFMIFAALLLAVFIEFEKQHRSHFVYAILLLLLITGAFYLNQHWVLTKVAIL